MPPSIKPIYYNQLYRHGAPFDPRSASLLHCWKGRQTAASCALGRENGERLVAATIDLNAIQMPRPRPWWTHLYVQVLGAILAGVLLGHYAPDLDRKSVVEGKSVSVRVDLGGRRIIKKKTQKQKNK